MTKAHVFPGQGSQFPGMAKEIYETIPEAKALMERANQVLGFRITDIMFGEDANALKAFLEPRYQTMPRTMLRYAIEKFPDPDRSHYLAR